MKIIDISQEVFSCSVYPGDSSPVRNMVCKISEGSICNLTEFTMCAHNGTHTDAPYHFYDDGRTVDEIPLEQFIGKCYVGFGKGEFTKEDAEKLLLKAKNADAESARRILIAGDTFVSLEAAKVFAQSGVLLVGNESQTVGPCDAPAAVHYELLGKGVVLLEGVRLSGVSEGVYMLCAAPLNLGGSDGAPCRAVLIEE